MFDWIRKQVAPGRVWEHTPGAAERQGSSHATADRRAACHLWHGAAAAAAAAATSLIGVDYKFRKSREFATGNTHCSLHHRIQRKKLP